ncbi:MAG: hypothetical protein P0Y58_02440 [Candidatus Pseudomonas phytovorans]|uniref:Uncharacterized protein n=1 Tax=Candidatus Pseudomonas phytovorans TaxID=3121377 RepID=A0AAJ5WK15_9PSED|nr:hypothetical protein [Pseudomonas sp.]WEK31067.1 MAG: hypothetical protein P0Y58_02440 [Pseudomonas sp.]
MIIECKNWKAQHDKMPPGARLRVHGTITVGHPGVVPVLVKRAIQDKSFALALELELKREEGIFNQVVCDKEVRIELPGEHGPIPKVDIFHEGKLIGTITEIIETH